jgi:polar amino acid transport system substrate-binding protein
MNSFVKRVFLLILIFILPITPVFSANYTIYTEEIPPWNYTFNQKLTGISVEIVTEILSELKIEDKIQVVPWARGYRATIAGDSSVLFSIARTQHREKLFHWVGPLATEKVYFYKRKESDIQLESIDEARNVATILVTREFPEHQYLQKLAFKNIHLTTYAVDNFRMLMGYRGELTAAGEYTAGFLLRKAGIPQERISRTNVMLFENVLYIALSKDIPLIEVAKWQKALDKIKLSVKYLKIVNKYLGK